MSRTPGRGTFGMSPRAQWIVAVCLISALVVILVERRLSGSSAMPDAPAASPEQQRRPNPPEAAALAVLQAELTPATIPQPPRVVFLAHDPFKPGEAMLQALTHSGPGSGGLDTPGGQTLLKALTAQAQALGLKAVSGEKEEALAFLGDQLVRRGDTIDGFEVVAIHSREVVIEKQGFRFALSLPPPGSSHNEVEVLPSPHDPGPEGQPNP